MELEKLFSLCGGGDCDCPTLLVDRETGDYVVQGYVDAEVQKLNAPDGEGFVRIPGRFFRGMLDFVKNSE